MPDDLGPLREEIRDLRQFVTELRAEVRAEAETPFERLRRIHDRVFEQRPRPTLTLIEGGCDGD